MKKFTLLMGLLLLGTFVMSSLKTEDSNKSRLPLEDDSYKVIRVNGQIVFSKNGNSMKTGDVFASNEKLNFKSSDSRAAVISRKRGRFVLTSNTSSAKANLIPFENPKPVRTVGLITHRHFVKKRLFNRLQAIIKQAVKCIIPISYEEMVIKHLGKM